MFKKFLEGLAFGTGLTIAFVVISTIAAMVLPFFMKSSVEWGDMESSSHMAMNEPDIAFRTRSQDNGTSFFDRPIDDQIKMASAIAVARFEPAPDGRMKAVIKEFLKLEPNAHINYKVGEEYPSASFYPQKDSRQGDGVVIFFTGEPGMMRMSMSFSGGRISGLGDLPMRLLREKCKAPKA